jgi:hypothetical protein
MAVPELCAHCPLQASCLDAPRIVETVRGRASEDKAAILALPAGEAVLAALRQDRPERCRQLDEILPGKRVRHASRRPDHVLFDSCPEMALASHLSPSEFPELPAEI